MQDDAIRRGDVFFADLSPSLGCEQRGVRPVLVVQNNVGNRFSPTTIVIPITAKEDRNPLPTHVRLSLEKSGLQKHSILLVEQVRTIDKKRLRNKVCRLEESLLREVDEALKLSLGLKPLPGRKNTEA